MSGLVVVVEERVTLMMKMGELTRSVRYTRMEHGPPTYHKSSVVDLVYLMFPRTECRTFVDISLPVTFPHRQT
jgi:hypothetical protein